MDSNTRKIAKIEKMLKNVKISLNMADIENPVLGIEN